MCDETFVFPTWGRGWGVGCLEAGGDLSYALCVGALSVCWCSGKDVTSSRIGSTSSVEIQGQRLKINKTTFTLTDPDLVCKRDRSRLLA